MFNEINNYLKYINLFWNQLIGYFFFKYKNILKNWINQKNNIFPKYFVVEWPTHINFYFHKKLNILHKYFHTHLIRQLTTVLNQTRSWEYVNQIHRHKFIRKIGCHQRPEWQTENSCQGSMSKRNPVPAQPFQQHLLNDPVITLLEQFTHDVVAHLIHAWSKYFHVFPFGKYAPLVCACVRDKYM